MTTTHTLPTVDVQEHLRREWLDPTALSDQANRAELASPLRRIGRPAPC